MTMQNRVKCEASLDVDGMIVVGAALPGYVAATDSWSPGGSPEPGVTRYLLENSSGLWEMGYVQVDDGNNIVWDSNFDPDPALPRFAKESNIGNSRFASGTMGLTLSMCARHQDVWFENGNYSWSGAGATPPVISSGLAVGGGSTVDANYGTAIAGGIVLTDAIHAIAVGSQAVGRLGGEIAVGGFLAFKRDFPIQREFVSASGTVAFQQLGGAALNFADYGLVNGPASTVWRVQATVRCDDTTDQGVVAYTSAHTMDYFIHIQSPGAGGGATVTVLGTPAIAAAYTGGSAMAVTLSVGSDGAPNIATSGGRTVRATGYVTLTIIPG